MTFLGPEAICDAVAAYVAASQTAKISAVNARYPTYPLVMPDFLAIRISEPSLNFEGDFPVLHIMPDSGVPQPAMGGHTVAVEYPFEFCVLTWGTDTTTQVAADVVKRLSMRYILAVYEMLVDMHSHTDATYHVNGQPLHWGTGEQQPVFYYAPTYNREKQYIGDARLMIGVETVEVV